MKKLLLVILMLLISVNCYAFTGAPIDDANCLGAWLFTDTDYDSGSGTTVADHSGEGNTGTFNDVTWDTDDVSFNVSGSADNSGVFDGNDYVSFDSGICDVTGSAFTIVAWIRPDSDSGGEQQVFRKSTDSHYNMVINNNDLRLEYYASATRTTWDYDNITTAWQHIAVVYDGSDDFAYVNGFSKYKFSFLWKCIN